jgi:hypothetical protein
VANHTVAADEVGAYNKQLAAATADKVTFGGDVDQVEVFGDGTAAIYFTVDKTVPVVEGAHTYELPNGLPSSRVVSVPTAGDTEVRLISAGTPHYSVNRG